MNTNTLLPQDAAQASESIKTLTRTLNSVIFGQENLVELVIIGLLSRGHLLLEGLPGLGKTELVKTLSKALLLDSKRVQFTPDLLPGDITGNPMLQEVAGTRTFVFQPGPVFTNLLLADEINRASPKTQSALLEAMQERRVTVMGQSHELPAPFFVLATQNPIELEGTYPLPEAQLDRFLFKLSVRSNPVEVLEKIIMERQIGAEPKVPQVMDGQGLVRLSDMARSVYLPPVVANYIARLVAASQPGNSESSKHVQFGASPRAALALAAASRSKALLEGRTHTSYEDVQALAVPVLNHRILLDYQAKLDGLDSVRVIEMLLKEIPAVKKEAATLLEAAKL